MTKQVLPIALLTLGLGLTTAGCQQAVSPNALSEWQGRSLYTCCNIYYENSDVVDANYHVGQTLPFGSPVQIVKMTNDSATFRSGATELTLRQSYGTAEESSRQYFAKVFVDTDPHTRFATFPSQVRSAITDGRVEIGMTKEQVILSLGYPATHRTKSTDLDTWVYWRNRWLSYHVEFGPDGKVVKFVGNAPTNGETIAASPAPAASTPKKKSR